MRNTRVAFRWIIAILRNHKIPFRISGGLAANAYGSKRKLADIDIDIPSRSFGKVMPDVSKYLIFGPERYRDKEWDLLLATLKYKSQEIDLCGAGTTKIFNKTTGKWERLDADLSNSYKTRIFGKVVPIVPKDELIAYKSKLLRKVDIADLKSIGTVITIQKAKKSDFSDMYGLIKELWPREKFNRKSTKDVFLKQWPNKDFIVAKSGNKIIGFASLMVKYSLGDKGKIGIIDELVVDREFRNKGVGRKLLAEITAMAKKSSCKDLVLTSAFYRKGAHRFYLKNGFRKTAYEFYKKL
jgi:GNAT superfamily N-acetyltransferase